MNTHPSTQKFQARKALLTAAIAALLAAFALVGAGCAPASEGSSDQPQEEQTPTITATVEIDGSRGGVEPTTTEVTLAEGTSVYDALIVTGATVSAETSYVTDIDGLSAQFPEDTGRGWLYFVNGESPTVGCTEYILTGGEKITWVFTRDMGNDL